MNVRCPHCNKALRAPDDLAGKMVKCPGCGKAVKLPEPKPAAAADEQPDALDLGALESVETGGEAVEVQRSGRKMRVAEARAAQPTTRKDPNVRICPTCRGESRVKDPYLDVICAHCGKLVPGRQVEKRGDARYADSMVGRITAPVSFYGGFANAVLYPLPALTSILFGIVVALAAILVPVGLVVGFAAGSGLNPISEKADLTWVGLFLLVMFAAEGVYFGGVNYYILIDTIRTTASASEKPPALTWNLISLGNALLGYLALTAYYAAITLLLIWLANDGRLVLPNTDDEIRRVLTPFNLFVLALVTFAVPMNLIGLAGEHIIDGLNPVRVFKSIGSLIGHYAFLFLIVVLYLGFYIGVMTWVVGWASAAILSAVEHGLGEGVTNVALGLAAWAALIGAGFYFTYVMGRILGLFARSFSDRLEFDI